MAPQIGFCVIYVGRIGGQFTFNPKRHPAARDNFYRVCAGVCVCCCVRKRDRESVRERERETEREESQIERQTDKEKDNDKEAKI